MIAMNGTRSSRLQVTRDIVEAIRGGDRSAFNTLFQRAGGRVFVYVNSRMGEALRRRVDPEDLLQEVYVEAFRSFDTFEEAGPGSFVRWMIGIAGNVTRRAHERHFERKRRNARREIALDGATGSGLDLPTPDISPSRRVALNEGVQRVARAVDGLDALDREVILLHVFEGLTIENVARTLNRPRTTITYRLARALSRLESQVPELNTVW